MVDDDSGAAWSFDLRHDLQARDEFLAFGYVPWRDGLGDPLELLSAWSREPVALGRASAAERGVTALLTAVQDAAEEAPAGSTHVVMLSGGRDSRAILGALLREYSPGEVVAATFGVPGELDYDIARQVAKVAGIEHVVLDTRQAPWTTDELVRSIAAQGPPYPYPYPFGQRFLRYELLRQIGAGCTYWDGLCGESIGTLPDPGAGPITWDAAVTRWLDKKLVEGWQGRVRPGFRPELSLPGDPLLARDVLSYRDQLDFAVEERRRTATRIVRGYRILTPFLQGAWLDLMLGADREYRVDAHLYREVLGVLDRRLFDVPIARSNLPVLTDGPMKARARSYVSRTRRRLAGMAGRRTVAVSGANGTIRRLIREPGPVRDLVRTSLLDLKARGLTVVPTADDLRLDGDQHREAVDLYVSFELNLKALEQISPEAPAPAHP